MNYVCSICGRSVDKEGFPTATPEIYGPVQMRFCIGHRLAAAQERFRTELKFKKLAGNCWRERKVEVRVPYNDA